MKKWLKKHFIPHEGNGHRPHILHRKNAAQLIGVILFFELILFVLPGLNFVSFLQTLNVTAVLPGVLSALTNAERLENNLPELRENPLLDEAARLKAEDMARNAYFAHTSPEGKTPWYWFQKAGYSYVYAGENLAVNFIDSADVTEAWMNSPTHRANIIKGAYTEMGTGIATGVYKGNQTVFVAQVYGRPAVVAAAERSISKSSDESMLSSASEHGQISLNNAPPSPEPANVLGEAQVKSPSTNRVTQNAVKEFFKEAAASPRQATDAMLYSVLGIITLALLFNIFIKIKHQHPDLILNGAVVMAVILALHITNGYVSQTRALETSFIAFDADNRVQE
ncbi:MAG: hypothetical protein A3J09_01220 [Candidatus Zambryskibacteria bacterium RIFCSPLOWO2_02_FULL_51_21]|uniref:SCP domain-containing protein n=1 Tax=Candidatus Zambryskibacteria bacterium RIFCSPHIGHO2_02_FULL_43_37 TaxID=1802749 RepID=A0A1G2TGY5_9BACT|nr:MAG: hypothetical protein A3D49_01680 [Candidatus Zambryskibacteria bacterium RIFCSPHIGHO2_02_FULL_43_37]OHB11171.1 MAG: hypothetical protein A3J09_01220 [Candidatus Zambryskibacteria bacterium RIFCSPLOWO2_02_FULL_51_21]